MDEADELLLRAIGIQEKALGPDHPGLASSLSSRAGVLRIQVDEFSFLAMSCLYVSARTREVVLHGGIYSGEVFFVGLVVFGLERWGIDCVAVQSVEGCWFGWSV